MKRECEVVVESSEPVRARRGSSGGAKFRIFPRSRETFQRIRRGRRAICLSGSVVVFSFRQPSNEDGITREGQTRL